MKRALIVLFVLVIALSARAQDFIKKAEINGSFQVDGQVYQADDALGITDW